MNDLNFKDFLKVVVLETTLEDERDDTFFGLKDWVEVGFIGIPSSEVQRYIDKNIPIWLESQETAQTFVKNLCEIELKQLGIRSAAISARFTVEKNWKNKNDNRPIATVELVEKWLKDETSVSKEELRTAGNATAWAAADAAWAAAWAAADAAWAAASAAYAARAAASAAYAGGNTSGSNREVCDVIRAKLPKFNFEDLVRWKYFSG